MTPRTARSIACLRRIALCSLLLLRSTGAIGAPGTVLLDRGRPEHEEPGIEVEGAIRAGFPSLGSAAADFRARLGNPNEPRPNPRPIASLDGYEFFSLAGIRASETPRQSGVSVVVRHTATGAASILVEVFVDEGLGVVSNAEVFRSPVGPLFRIPLRLSGTGAMNRDLFFLWQRERLSEIDAHTWLARLRLEPLGFAPGAGIRKGVTVNPADLSARVDVWNEADANCCPSAGSVEVVLSLREGRLEVRRAVPRLAASSQPGPPSR